MGIANLRVFEKDERNFAFQLRPLNQEKYHKQKCHKGERSFVYPPYLLDEEEPSADATVFLDARPRQSHISLSEVVHDLI